MAHSKRKREQALARMEASARDHGGAPAFALLAEALAIPETNLRRWWADRDKKPARKAKPAPKPNVHLLPKPDRMTPEPGQGPIDPLAAPPSAFWAWMFAETYGDIRDAKEQEAAPYVVAQMRPALGDYYEKVRASLAEERKHGAHLSRDEQRARLREFMANLSPDLATDAADVLRGRGIVA